jgi:hypothetical protein
MPSISRNELKKAIDKGTLNTTQQELAYLRLHYSEISNLQKSILPKLQNRERIYPTILPTQASGRWSYLNPPLSNFPKKCINPDCPKYHHEKTAECWSIRDCILPEENTFWIEHDLDAVEHRIYALILNWKERIEALKSGIDIHTPVTCELFNLPYPQVLLNPHTSVEDTEWRASVKWQGKDDSRRTMSKNFTYGGQYFYVEIVRDGVKTRLPFRIYQNLKYSPGFVYSIPNIQSYKILNPLTGELEPPNYEELAVRFVESNIEIQKAKAVLMEKYRRDKESRTLYGGKRHAWIKSKDAAKELFNHTIQGTVASYINESCILLQKEFPSSYLIHNQHDSLKWAFYYDSITEEGRKLEEQQVLAIYKSLTQRELTVGQNSLMITATFKLVRS